MIIFVLLTLLGTLAVIAWLELWSALQRFCDSLPNSIEHYEPKDTPKWEKP